MGRDTNVHCVPNVSSITAVCLCTDNNVAPMLKDDLPARYVAIASILGGVSKYIWRHTSHWNRTSVSTATNVSVMKAGWICTLPYTLVIVRLNAKFAINGSGFFQAWQIIKPYIPVRRGINVLFVEKCSVYQELCVGIYYSTVERSSLNVAFATNGLLAEVIWWNTHKFTPKQRSIPAPNVANDMLLWIIWRVTLSVTQIRKYLNAKLAERSWLLQVLCTITCYVHIQLWDRITVLIVVRRLLVNVIWSITAMSTSLLATAASTVPVGSNHMLCINVTCWRCTMTESGTHVSFVQWNLCSNLRWTNTIQHTRTCCHILAASVWGASSRIMVLRFICWYIPVWNGLDVDCVTKCSIWRLMFTSISRKDCVWLWILWRNVLREDSCSHF